MLKEALSYIFEQAKEGDNPKPHVFPIGPRRQLFVLRGEQTEVETEAGKLARTATSLESLASIILHEKTGDAQNVSQVFVSEAGVAVVLDQEDRIERVEMKFTHSPQFKALQSLQTPVNQKQFVKVLRSSLYGCCSYAEIVNVARKIEFTRNSDGRTSVEHGRESLGRSVEKAVQSSSGNIPEELTFRVNLLCVPSDINTLVELRFALEINVDDETLSLLPIGDIDSRERQRVVNDITARLDQLVPEGTLVVSGTVA